MRNRKFLIAGLGVGLLLTGALLVWRSADRRSVRAREFEGKAGAKALCLAVSEYHQARGVWIQASPEPVSIPGLDGVEFRSTREFEQLGFAPGLVRFQYEVRAVEQGSECIARGDPDGDGVVTEFKAIATK